MKAIVFRGAFDVGVETRAKPTIRDQTDAIIKVKVAGICGRYYSIVFFYSRPLYGSLEAFLTTDSELHMYRGHQKTATGHIMVCSATKQFGKRLNISPAARVMNSLESLIK